MQTGCMLIDWDEALRRNTAGTLLDDVLEAGEEDLWLYRPSEMEWPSDSTLQYLAVAAFIKESTATLSETSRTAIQISIGKLIAEETCVDDLEGGLGDEGCIATLNPIHAVEMSKAMTNIAKEELHRYFNENPKKRWTDILKSFDDDVWQYIEQWQRMLSIAAERGMGFHAYMG